MTNARLQALIDNGSVKVADGLTELVEAFQGCDEVLMTLRRDGKPFAVFAYATRDEDQAQARAAMVVERIQQGGGNGNASN